MKKLLIIVLATIPLLVYGQGKNARCNYDTTSKSDAESSVIELYSEISGKTNKDKECGYYTILKIDNLDDFYLIFIEKNKTKGTIYSEKCISPVGRKLEVDSTYYLELTCKDTLYNGVCWMPVTNVTYFGKYLGYDLRKLYIARGLCGLYLESLIERSDPKHEEILFLK